MPSEQPEQGDMVEQPTVTLEDAIQSLMDAIRTVAYLTPCTHCGPNAELEAAERLEEADAWLRRNGQRGAEWD